MTRLLLTDTETAELLTTLRLRVQLLEREPAADEDDRGEVLRLLALIARIEAQTGVR